MKYENSTFTTLGTETNFSKRTHNNNGEFLKGHIIFPREPTLKVCKYNKIAPKLLGPSCPLLQPQLSLFLPHEQLQNFLFFSGKLQIQST